ncbi:hypothetical protein PIROE2DRAFT_12758 [Piromyces sp. E2]|nr:hypothetical protein PIROE2DRAFT_12758 [Piromyces sp. E2]|eukprot:OUM61265.1 hypothetical protein PIROE2DRAFT_12758 [Piromyces sp. E2]
MRSSSAFNCIRYLYPSSTQEKSVFYSTYSLVPVYGNDYYDYYYKTNLQSPADPSKLCDLMSDPSVPFKPTLLIGVLGFNDLRRDLNNNVYNMIRPVKFSLEFDIGVTFRGLRKSQVVSVPQLTDFTDTLHNLTRYNTISPEGIAYNQINLATDIVYRLIRVGKYGEANPITFYEIMNGTNGDSNVSNSPIKGYRTVSHTYMLKAKRTLLVFGYDRDDQEWVFKIYGNHGNSSGKSINANYIQYYYCYEIAEDTEDSLYITCFNSTQYEGGQDSYASNEYQPCFNMRDYNYGDDDAAAVYLTKNRFCIYCGKDYVYKDNKNNSFKLEDIYPGGLY